MGPLAGVVVLDLGQYLAGPYAPMLLADLGAEVIKVEPVTGDRMRAVGKPFLGCQRGKQGLAVDVKAPDGREAVLRLGALADVVHHNMTKGTAARLGLDHDAFRERNPEVVYCNTYAYGAEGPLSDFGGLDPLYQAACGLEYEAGAVAEGNPPLYIRLGMADTANALVSVVGVLAALYHRGQGGGGQDVWTSLLNGAAVLSSDVFLVDGRPGPARPPLDRVQAGVSPCYRLYETQEGWIQVAAFGPGQWDALCRVLGRPELGPRHPDFDGRVRDRAEIEAVLEPVWRTRTALVWQALLDDAGVDCEVSVDTGGGEAVLHDADNVSLGLVTEYEQPRLGRVRQFGTLFGFSATPTGPYSPAPQVGQHTRAVLTRVGYTDGEIDDLLGRGVVYEPDDGYSWSS